MSSRSAFTSDGRRVALGALLGRGGEGAVYALPGQPGRVAKLYHRQPEQAKQDKLRHMVAAADVTLLDYCAWPQATLHARDGGVAGFVMQDIGARRPIHAVYSPIDRLETLPHAGFDMLVVAARNTAAAFCTLHAHGHVVGDVNQGNLVVDADARVMLIDCDSFQVRAGDALHLCEVGVAHFTPPELQGLPSFAGCVRSANHDNFGLALLLFHLLMGGRHPFSGVPRSAQAGEALEADIRALRYAYAPDATRRGLTPPPRTVPIEVLPLPLRQLFVDAFTEPGLRGQRPTARDWLHALDATAARLRTCAHQRRHRYPSHLLQCAWCALESRDVVLFADPVSLGPPRVAVAAAWQQIDAVPAPPAIQVPRMDPRSLPIATTPARLPGRQQRLLHLLLAALFALTVLALAPGASVLAAILGTLAFQLANSFAEAPFRRELARRRAAVIVARAALQAELAAAEACAGPTGFLRTKARLREVRDALERATAPGIAVAARGRRGRRGQRRGSGRRRALERMLLAGPAVLRQYRRQAGEQLAAAQPRLQAAARQLAQAEANLATLGGRRWSR